MEGYFLWLILLCDVDDWCCAAPPADKVWFTAERDCLSWTKVLLPHFKMGSTITQSSIGDIHAFAAGVENWQGAHFREEVGASKKSAPCISFDGVYNSPFHDK